MGQAKIREPGAADNGGHKDPRKTPQQGAVKGRGANRRYYTAQRETPKQKMARILRGER